MSLPARPGFGFARRHGATVRALDDTQAEIIYRPGVAPEVIAELRRHVARPITLCPQSAEDYERLLRQLYEGGADDARAMAADFDERADLNQLVDALPEPQDLLESEDEAPIIRLINALLTEAVKENASDIHLEPFEHSLLVRFRVDGVLREVLRPQKAVAQPVVSRIKVMAKLDIAEKRLPQDGRISLRIAGRPVDVRVSTIPAGFGERVVLRLLDKQAGRLDLAELGMDPVTLGHVDRLIHRPHGILLVEMTFARGLRAFLRQDRDVVMVGEIRDLETAEIAVQASLTGHLVLSTLHTNSAVGAVTRLRDMGVEPFLLSSSLLGVLAQRLVRRLDPAQSEWYTPSASECAAFGRQPVDGLRFARPRADLPGRASGYRGRSGVYEVVLVDEAMRALIHGGAAEVEMVRAARQHTPAILDDGWAKVTAGLTSADEVLRVTRDD